LTPLLARHGDGLPGRNLGFDSAVWLVSTSALSEVRSRRRVRGLPLSPLVCHTGVLRRWLVEVVRHPRVPARLDLGGIRVLADVLHPSRPEGQLVVVLEILVTKPVGSDQGSGLGVADVVHLLEEVLEADLAKILDGAPDGRHDGGCSGDARVAIIGLASVDFVATAMSLMRYSIDDVGIGRSSSSAVLLRRSRRVGGGGLA